MKNGIIVGEGVEFVVGEEVNDPPKYYPVFNENKDVIGKRKVETLKYLENANGYLLNGKYITSFGVFNLDLTTVPELD